MNKKVYIPIALLLLIAGLLCLNNEFCDNVINFLGYLFHKELSHVFWKYGLQHTGVELILFSVLVLLYVFFLYKRKKLFFIISSACVIATFIIYAYCNSVNFPIAEDYNHFLKFLNYYSVEKKIINIFDQEDDVRVTMMHLWSVLLYKLGNVNFILLILFSNACVIISYFILLKLIPNEYENKEFIFLILAILIFQFQYYDVSTWASGGIYHGCTAFYAIITFYLLNKKNVYYYFFALCFSAISIMNCPAGFSVIAVGLILLTSEKRIKEALIWIGISVLIIVAYLHNYSTKDIHAFSETSFAAITNRVVNGFLFSCTFLGGFFQFMYDITLPIVFGLSIWICFILLTVKKYYKKNPVIYFMLLFILLTSLMPPIDRAFCRIDAGLTVRYGIYSIIGVACCLIALFEIVNKKYFNKYIKIAFIFSITYHLATNIFFYPEDPIRKELLSQLILKIKNKGDYVLPPHTPVDGKEILNESIKKKIYTLPE